MKVTLRFWGTCGIGRCTDSQVSLLDTVCAMIVRCWK